MQEHSVSLYAIDFYCGKDNLKSHTVGVQIVIDQKNNLPIFQISMRLDRQQYEKWILPYKSQLKINIRSYKGMSSDDATNIIQPVIDTNLTIIYEFSDQTFRPGADSETSASLLYTFICVPLNLFKKQQKLIKNKVFLDKNRKQILEEALEGTNIEVKTTYYKPNEIIEQVIIPPVREVGVIDFLHHRWKLFNGSYPLFAMYSIFDSKLYIGSCNTNDFTPLRILLASDMDFSQSGDIADSASVANKNKNSRGMYSIHTQIKEVIHYPTMATSIGAKETYCFQPIDKLYSRVNFVLKDITTNSNISNAIGENEHIIKHLKDTNIKETWHIEHNGLLDISTDDDKNKIFSEHYSTKYLNQSNELIFSINGALKFDDVFYPGRRVQLNADVFSARFQGRYYLSKTALSFVNNGLFWSCQNQIHIKTGLDTKKL